MFEHKQATKDDYDVEYDTGKLPKIKKKKRFRSFSKYCELEDPRALSYALLIISQSKIKSISTAFIDGYNNNKVENKLLQKVISSFSNDNKIKINFLTKTLFRN